MLHVRFVLLVRQVRQFQRQVQLQETHVGRIGQSCTVAGGARIETAFAKGGFQEIHPPLRDPRHGGLHQRVIQRLQQRSINTVRLGLAGNPAEKCAQPLTRRVPGGADVLLQLAVVARFPAIQRRL